MAKRRKNSKSQSTGGRVLNTPPNASYTLPRLSNIYSSQAVLAFAQQSGIDNRRFHPMRNSPLRPHYTIGGNPAPVKSTFKKGKPLHGILSFAVPEKTAVCVRRKQRKEVIFATRHSGKNGMRKMRRNASSSISCRR